MTVVNRHKRYCQFTNRLSLFSVVSGLRTTICQNVPAPQAGRVATCFHELAKVGDQDSTPLCRGSMREEHKRFTALSFQSGITMIGISSIWVCCTIQTPVGMIQMGAN